MVESYMKQFPDGLIFRKRPEKKNLLCGSEVILFDLNIFLCNVTISIKDIGCICFTSVVTFKWKVLEYLRLQFESQGAPLKRLCSTRQPPATPDDRRCIR